MPLTNEQIVSIKGRGFLLNKGTENFSGRVVPRISGVFSAEDLAAIAECAARYGSGKVAFTSRLNAEIVGIPFDKIEEAEAFLASHGIRFGGTGAKVRPITACKGTTCVYGNIDTQALSGVLHDRFYVELGHVKLPHKFKIGVGGCPNSCMKPSLNDVGIEGNKVFTFDADKCRGCKVCMVANRCTMKAAKVLDGKCTIDTDKCIKCGVCVGKCPFGAVPREAESMCRVYVGGTWGKSSRMGTRLQNLVKVEQVPEIIEKVMLWYKENGYAKERLGACIDRVGMDKLEAALACDDLILRREEIFAAPVKER